VYSQAFHYAHYTTYFDNGNQFIVCLFAEQSPPDECGYTMAKARQSGLLWYEGEGEIGRKAKVSDAEGRTAIQAYAPACCQRGKIKLTWSRSSFVSLEINPY
jgi:hypothetical protein